MNSKTCSVCKKGKLATVEFFATDKRASDGLRSECKVCQAQRNREYYEANKERVREINQRWLNANKERMAECQAAWYKSNKSHRDKYEREYREKHRERIAQYQREYRQVNKERLAEVSRRWRKNNTERRAALHQRRRILKRNAKGTHTIADIQAQYKAQEGLCYYCKCEVGDTYHVDHVVPLSRGGSNSPENLVVACPTCNMSKGAKLPHEWIQGGRLL